MYDVEEGVQPIRFSVALTRDTFKLEGDFGGVAVHVVDKVALDLLVPFVAHTLYLIFASAGRLVSVKLVLVPLSILG